MWLVKASTTEVVWWVAGTTVTYSGTSLPRLERIVRTLPGAWGYMSFAMRRWLQIFLSEGRLAPPAEIAQEFIALLRYYIAKGRGDFHVWEQEAAELREAHARMATPPLTQESPEGE